MARRHKAVDLKIPPPINTAASQLADAMLRENVTKGEMAARLKTSYAQVRRLLNPKHNSSLSSLSRAAAIVGLRVTVEFTGDGQE